MSKITKFVDAATALIFDDTGVDVTGCFSGRSLSDFANWQQIKTVKINPKMAGPMAPMFASITLTIEVAWNDEGGHLCYYYEYKHPTGSNGYTVRKTFPVA